MHLDVPTLLVASTSVTGLGGLLLLLAWWLNPRITALAWWGASNLVAAIGVGLLAARGVIPDAFTIVAGNAIIMTAYGLLWSGMRVFEGRAVRPGWAALGAGVWLAACQVPAIFASVEARIVLASSMMAAYAAAAFVEIWRGRGERLISRYPVLIVLAIHAAFFAARVPFALTVPRSAAGASFHSAWFAIFCFETLLHAVALIFILVTMAKERVELEHRVAAETDPLTGIANRRAFWIRAEDLIRRAGADGATSALLLFDLDRFKAVNDTYGHAVGDRVLMAFCRVATARLGPEVAFGRLGGEEFACFLPGVAPYAAERIAERVRAALAHVDVEGMPRTTVSVGVAACRPGDDLGRLLERADAALYRAKAGGRNRVELAADPAKAATWAA